MRSKPYLPAITAAAITVLGASLVFAQAANSSSTAPAPKEKPSPYQGVSNPPADDAIVTSSEPPPAAPAQTAPPAQPAAQTPAPAPAAVPAPATAAAPVADPDAGIVDSLPAHDAEASQATLHTRDAADYEEDAAAGADGQIVTSLPGPANALPAGTVFKVRLLQGIVSGNVEPGTAFRATLGQDLMHDGHVVVPEGSELRGKIVYASSGSHLNGQAMLHLRPDAFILPDGSEYRLHAEVIDTLGSDTKATGEGNIVPKDDVMRTLALVGAGAGGGALLGAKIGGGMGAAVGSAVGAGVMTAHWLMVDRVARLPYESTLFFSLTDPMYLTPLQPLRN